YARVQAIYEKRDGLGLSPEARYLVERDRLAFVRAGAALTPDQREALSKINLELAALGTAFAEKLLAETNAAPGGVARRDEMAGLPAGALRAAAGVAKEKKLEGRWLLPLQNTTQQPPLDWLEDRALRQQILTASMGRGARGGENDTRSTVARM